jgi:hypothetical protein
LKVNALISILQSLPQNYDVTYDNEVGHILLKKEQVSTFHNAQEILLQTHMKLKI